MHARTADFLSVLLILKFLSAAPSALCLAAAPAVLLQRRMALRA
jgi:hypothetical protein